jgi:hypothetical protein
MVCRVMLCSRYTTARRTKPPPDQVSQYDWRQRACFHMQLSPWCHRSVQCLKRSRGRMYKAGAEGLASIRHSGSGSGLCGYNLPRKAWTCVAYKLIQQKSFAVRKGSISLDGNFLAYMHALISVV